MPRPTKANLNRRVPDVTEYPNLPTTRRLRDAEAFRPRHDDPATAPTWRNTTLADLLRLRDLQED